MILGDAGSQELLRRYDASVMCAPEKSAAQLSCPSIALGVLNTLEGGPANGIASAFYASVLCGKDLRAISDCYDRSETMQSSAAKLVSDCHDRGGTVGALSSTTEVICEVASR